ncbi:MAG: hypothetical protein NT029_03820 [Armatimonadetes bacterium]|nr:hypothetical protein [Armatimonadota bacterium]
MDDAELAFSLAAVPGIGEKSIAAILRRVAVGGMSPVALLEMGAPALMGEFGLRHAAADAIVQGLRPAAERAALELRRLRRQGVQLLTVADASYPAALGAFLDAPPPLLCAYGDVRLLSRPLVMAANSNGAPPEALAACDEAMAVALAAGMSPVTGHNRIEYQRPALVALRAAVGVVYVLDRGIVDALGEDLDRELFPAAGIWTGGFDPGRHLALSPFGPRDHWLGANNRRRDEMIAALATLVLVGHVTPGGGMDGICRRAVKAGRGVVTVGDSMNVQTREAIVAMAAGGG